MNTADIKTLWRSLPLSAENDLEALDRQIERNPGAWEAAGRFLQHSDLDALPLGRNEIGVGCFANVQEYETRLASKYEVHRRYIDVQLLARGEELVYVADLADAREPQGDFDVEADFLLYASAQRERRVRVSPQAWLILYPTDAHMPCMAIDGQPRAVRKVVVKIPFA